MQLFKLPAQLSPALFVTVALVLASGCATAPRVGSVAPRKGDEIVIAGRYVHTGTPVVLWTDPGGYDAYRVERHFAPLDQADWKTTQEQVKDLDTTNRYNLRRSGLSEEEIERVRNGGWDLPTLQKVVDQFVLHYDVCGTSRQCFKVLHDLRGLSVHFLLDLDGTIYQTLDVNERAWHATTSNSRSVGIEIADMGAYGNEEKSPLGDWYQLGAILLLFEVGLESTPRDMMAVRIPATLVALVGVVTPMLLGYGVDQLAHGQDSWMAHAFVGAMLAATSVGITARVLQGAKAIKTPSARIILGVAVIDDVLGLVVLAIIAGVIRAAAAGTALGAVGIVAIMAKAFAFLFGAIAIGSFVSPRLFRQALAIRSTGVVQTLALSLTLRASGSAGAGRRRSRRSWPRGLDHATRQ